jgi:hypothetical protein
VIDAAARRFAVDAATDPLEPRHMGNPPISMAIYNTSRPTDDRRSPAGAGRVAKAAVGTRAASVASHHDPHIVAPRPMAKLRSRGSW